MGSLGLKASHHTRLRNSTTTRTARVYGTWDGIDEFVASTSLSFVAQSAALSRKRNSQAGDKALFS
eukprot:scaffold792_cov60-Phaeocystis_antarctica.AAC.7